MVCMRGRRVLDVGGRHDVRGMNEVEMNGVSRSGKHLYRIGAVERTYYLLSPNPSPTVLG
jgi:hypothetical protein